MSKRFNLKPFFFTTNQSNIGLEEIKNNYIYCLEKQLEQLKAQKSTDFSISQEGMFDWFKKSKKEEFAYSKKEDTPQWKLKEKIQNYKNSFNDDKTKEVITSLAYLGTIKDSKDLIDFLTKYLNFLEKSQNYQENLFNVFQNVISAGKKYYSNGDTRELISSYEKYLKKCTSVDFFKSLGLKIVKDDTYYGDNTERQYELEDQYKVFILNFTEYIFDTDNFEEDYETGSIKSDFSSHFSDLNYAWLMSFTEQSKEKTKYSFKLENKECVKIVDLCANILQKTLIIQAYFNMQVAHLFELPTVENKLFETCKQIDPLILKAQEEFEIKQIGHAGKNILRGMYHHFGNGCNEITVKILHSTDIILSNWIKS